jgi:two-component system, OmpR family, sensor histidine kinase KdpD
MTSARPNPDELLLRVQEEERKEKRGRLTIFFGAAPGVGKTFAMLLEAGFERDVEDRDVVAGVVETHGRFETTTLLAGFERMPKKRLLYRGTTLEEFDLDAALARRPSLLLLDELAHTNAEGSRHKKRWQDVEELLDAGIDVMTTLNVQHVESLNDVVAQITGIVVRETVPDSVIDAADEIKLIDLPPDELLERLREGKVYVPTQIERAMENFFRKGNLIALRELALRKTAERVDADMQAWRRAHGIEKTWAASDRLLVCISPSPHSATLLRTARRMAAGLHADWFAVTVETPITLRLSAKDRARISDHLRFAEQLGAEAVILTGQQAAAQIIKFAREKNITKILVGKPRILRFLDHFGKSFVDQLILGSGDIDVYVTAGEPEKAERAPSPAGRGRPRETGGYSAAVMIVALATIVGYLLFGRQHLADVAMTYLLGVVFVSTRFSFRCAVLGAVLSVLCFDFFFIPPYLTFTVSDARHAVTFAVMLLVAVVISGLNQRVRDQARFALSSERRTAMLYALSRELSRSLGWNELARVAGRHVEDAFESHVAIFTVEDGRTNVEYATKGFDVPFAKEEGVVRWVFGHRREAGLGTDTLAGSQGYYHPLTSPGAEQTVFGVFGIYPKDPDRFQDLEQRRLVDAFANQIALAIERTHLAEETARARLQIEAEQLRSTLLSSVSHDLRTPLAVMKGSASTLVDDDLTLDPEARRDLAQALLEETERLDRLVRDLLDMTRLESGAVRLKKEWQPVEEVLGAALTRTERRLGKRPISTSVRGDLLGCFDAVLIEQVLVNLLENAAKYTPEGSPIDIGAERIENELVIEVSDRGPGVAPGDEVEIFEKFRRGAAERAKSGIGLGLTICRAIVVAHGGRIWVENRSGGGATFKFALPLRGQPPAVVLPEIVERSEPDSKEKEARSNT